MATESFLANNVFFRVSVDVGSNLSRSASDAKGAGKSPEDTGRCIVRKWPRAGGKEQLVVRNGDASPNLKILIDCGLRRGVQGSNWLFWNFVVRISRPSAVTWPRRSPPIQGGKHTTRRDIGRNGRTL